MYIKIVESRCSLRPSSLGNGLIHTRFQHLRISSPNRHQFPLQMRSTQHLGHIKDNWFNCLPHHTAPTLRSCTMSYLQRSGLWTMQNPWKIPLFLLLEPYLLLRGRKLQTGSKPRSAETNSFAPSCWASYQLPMHIHFSLPTKWPKTLISMGTQNQKSVKKHGRHNSLEHQQLWRRLTLIRNVWRAWKKRCSRRPNELGFQGIGSVLGQLRMT